MSNYTDLISRLNKKTGPINLSEIVELLEEQTLPADALSPGSVERGVGEELRDLGTPVTRLGAVGDGSADDSEAFDVAFASGATIILVPPPALYYRINSSLVIPAGIHLIGQGRRPELRFSNATGARIIAGGDGCGLRNLTLNGNRAGSGDFSHLVDLGAYADCLIEDCLLTGSKRYGVYTTGARNKVRTCRIVGGVGGGVMIDGSDAVQNEVVGCELSNEQFGVLLNNGAAYNLVALNRSVPSAISLATSDGTPLSDLYNGYELIGITFQSHHNRVIGNHAKNTGDNGISCTGYCNTIVGNITENTWYNGITLAGFGNAANGNEIRNPARYNEENPGSPLGLAGINITPSFGGLARRNVAEGNVLVEDRVVPVCSYPIKIGGSTYTAWSSGEVLSQNAINGGLYRVVSSIYLYKATTAGTVGSVAPSHFSGSAVDNGGQVTWLFCGSNVLGPGDSYRKHASGLSILAGEVLWSGANVYRAQSPGTSGATPLSHTSGSASDGNITYDWIWSAGANLHAIYNVVGNNSCRGFLNDTVYLEQPLVSNAVLDIGRRRTYQPGKPTLPYDEFVGNVNPEGAITAYGPATYIRTNQPGTPTRQVYHFAGANSTSIGWMAQGGQPNTSAKTSDYTLTALDCYNKTFTNAGAGDIVRFDIPAAVAQMNVRFNRVANFAIRVYPSGSEIIGAGGAGKYLEIQSNNGWVLFVCEVAGRWIIVLSDGTTIGYQP